MPACDLAGGDGRHPVQVWLFATEYPLRQLASGTVSGGVMSSCSAVVGARRGAGCVASEAVPAATAAQNSESRTRRERFVGDGNSPVRGGLNFPAAAPHPVPP